jgi:hypothetical protein
MNTVLPAAVANHYIAILAHAASYGACQNATGPRFPKKQPTISITRENFPQIINA